VLEYTPLSRAGVDTWKALRMYGGFEPSFSRPLCHYCPSPL